MEGLCETALVQRWLATEVAMLSSGCMLFVTSMSVSECMPVAEAVPRYNAFGILWRRPFSCCCSPCPSRPRHPRPAQVCLSLSAIGGYVAAGIQSQAAAKLLPRVTELRAACSEAHVLVGGSQLLLSVHTLCRITSSTGSGSCPLCKPSGTHAVRLWLLCCPAKACAEHLQAQRLARCHRGDVGTDRLGLGRCKQAATGPYSLHVRTTAGVVRRGTAAAAGPRAAGPRHGRLCGRRV